MKSKKVISLLLMAAMSVSLLAGCGNSGKDSQTDTNPPEEKEDAAPSQADTEKETERPRQTRKALPRGKMQKVSMLGRIP